MEGKEKVYWFVDSEEDKPYDTTTWYRCFGIQDFIEKVEKEDRIVAFIVNGNNIGFILENKK